MGTARMAPRAALAIVLVACTAGRGDPPAGENGGRRPLTVTGEPLEPGAYVADAFSEPFSFTVGDATWIVRQVARDIVTLIGPRTEIAFAKPRLVFEKREALVPRPAPLPNDFVRWLERRPDLTTRRSAPASVGGLEGTAIDVGIEELYEEAELLGCPLPCIPLAPALAPEPLFLTHTHRVIVLGAGRPLVIVYATGDVSGERAARDLLATVRFRERS